MHPDREQAGGVMVQFGEGVRKTTDDVASPEAVLRLKRQAGVMQRCWQVALVVHPEIATHRSSIEDERLVELVQVMECPCCLVGEVPDRHIV